MSLTEWTPPAPAEHPASGFGGAEGFAYPGIVPAADGGHDLAPPGSEPWPEFDAAEMLADLRGQAQFLLYLADQIEDALGQIRTMPDPAQAGFLARLLQMYANQLEVKHAGLGERITETCQEVYVTTRGYDV